jgi:hypothetical protein
VRVFAVVPERNGHCSFKVDYAPFPDADSFRYWLMQPVGPYWCGAGGLTIPPGILVAAENGSVRIVGRHASVQLVRNQLLKLDTVRDGGLASSSA